ncbi:MULTISPECIES: OmpA family protein [Kluyvera]|uniref:OmpA family protein n=1 Tax=Kluyvera genomosp. 3 TaxID=2774055 RepID=A0A6G9RQY2_9ENTR|nr:MULTISPECIES: OmpA family protein [Kluyvera]QIR28201.1 OmpA family protein [Kluyvera genomosp. 3]UAK18322.1 OmpA family protein [Kluyvera sp. CRP]
MRKKIILSALLLLAGCTSTKVTLLPDATGHVGRVIVKNNDNQPVTLDNSGQTLVDGLLGEHEGQLSPADARQQRPALFKAEPAPLASETVWFPNDSVEPLSTTSNLIRRVRKDCLQRKPCQITIIGHTDGIGNNQYNMQLSLRRAQVIHDMLLHGGFPQSAMDIRYHGPFDPLIKTPSGRSQPKNRRVEIMVH